MVWTLALMISVVGAAVSGAEEPELDPLLELLVEQKVITLEQALAVQAEYDRREKTAATPPAAPETTAVVAAVEAPSAPKEKKKAAWYDRIEIKGDLRLRYEGFLQDGISDNDRRDRFRLRLRPGVYADINDHLQVGFQLRSGDRKDPVSDNQSVDGGFSMKEFAISEAFLKVDATTWLDATFGKFDPKKKWVVSDMQWDDDVTVEGALEELSFGGVSASLYQYVLEEEKGGDDAYLLGGQVRGSFDLSGHDSLTVGAAYDTWVEPQLVADLTLGGDLKGNKVTNLLDADNQLISDFDIVTLFATWKHSKSSRWPLKVSLFGYQNVGAKGLGKDNDTGYFARVQLGDYKEKGQVMVRYSRYYSEPDALFYVFTQSDTTRASDVDGHRFDLRIGYVKKSYFNITWYHTDAVYAEVPTMDRWQMDYIVRF
jgi:hypothetical protein